MKRVLLVISLWVFVDYATAFSLGNLNFLEDAMSKDLAEQFNNLPQQLQNQVGGLLLAGHIQAALGLLLLGTGPLGSSPLQNLNLNRLANILGNRDLLGNLPLNNILKDPLGNLLLNSNLPVNDLLGAVNADGDLLENQSLDNLPVNNLPVNGLLGGVNAGGDLLGNLPVNNLPANDLLGSVQAQGPLGNMPVNGLVENSPVSRLLGKRHQNDKRLLDLIKRDSLARDAANAEVGATLVTPHPGGFVVSIAKEMRDSNSWRYIRAKYKALDSVDEPLDVLLDFAGGDTARVDGLTSGVYYLVDLYVIDGAAVTHIFPRVRVYIP